MDEKDLMGEAFKQAQEAYDRGECPGGALIARERFAMAKDVIIHSRDWYGDGPRAGSDRLLAQNMALARASSK